MHSGSVRFSCSVVSDSLGRHGLQHARLPCPSPTPGAYSNSCPSHWWCHLTISSSVVPFSSCFQSFPASGSFPVSWFFTSGNQSIGISDSASVLPMHIQDWFPLGLTGWISLQSKGLLRVFSNTTVQLIYYIYFFFLTYFTLYKQALGSFISLGLTQIHSFLSLSSIPLGCVCVYVYTTSSLSICQIVFQMPELVDST